MIFNCLIAGIGGQGTLFASRLLATAAIKCGYDIRTTETIGMAQRGGSVVSHVRAGENIFSPLIPAGRAHVLIGFDAAEAVRQLPYLAEDGKLITCDGISKDAEISEYIKNNIKGSVVVPGGVITEKYEKMLNVALLGVAAQSGVFPMSIDVLIEVISQLRRYRDENLESFDLGRKLYLEFA